MVWYPAPEGPEEGDEVAVLQRREWLVDAKTMAPLKTDMLKGLTRHCPGRVGCSSAAYTGVTQNRSAPSRDFGRRPPGGRRRGVAPLGAWGATRRPPRRATEGPGADFGGRHPLGSALQASPKGRRPPSPRGLRARPLRHWPHTVPRRAHPGGGGLVHGLPQEEKHVPRVRPEVQRDPRHGLLQVLGAEQGAAGERQRF